MLSGFYFIYPGCYSACRVPMTLRHHWRNWSHLRKNKLHRKSRTKVGSRPSKYVSCSFWSHILLLIPAAIATYGNPTFLLHISWICSIYEGWTGLKIAIETNVRSWWKFVLMVETVTVCRPLVLDLKHYQYVLWLSFLATGGCEGKICYCRIEMSCGSDKWGVLYLVYRWMHFFWLV